MVIAGRATLGVGFCHGVFGDISPKECDGHGPTAHAKHSRDSTTERTLRRSHRDTARRLGISPGAVASVMSRATAIGVTWDALADLVAEPLEQRLYRP